MTGPSHLPLAFACGHRKSGTTMLANLLDGHPQLAMYPIDLGLLYAYFPEFVRAHDNADERRERLREVMFGEMRRRIEPGTFDIAALERVFFDGLPDDDLGRVDALIARLMAVFERAAAAPAARWGVFKETSIEIYASEMMDWFPDARFIHLVRDPRDNFAALAGGVGRYYSRIGEDHNRTLASLLNRVRTGFRMAQQNRTQFGDDRYLVLRFEDLTTEPETSMKAVADFLDIDFLPSLLTPTVFGRPTAGNAFDGTATFSVDSRNVNRWRERIRPEDAQVIEFHLAEDMAAFGYEPVFDEDEQARAAAEFYKWQNYAYFYSDRFAQGIAR